jgi:8-oxo-dGTP pyrophosphatase MutT (NUDIX family)
MQDQIARTVGALFISRDGKVLLGLRAPSKKAWPRHWDTIGGRVEDGESLDEASDYPLFAQSAMTGKAT